MEEQKNTKEEKNGRTWWNKKMKVEWKTETIGIRNSFLAEKFLVQDSLELLHIPQLLLYIPMLMVCIPVVSSNLTVALHVNRCFAYYQMCYVQIVTKDVTSSLVYEQLHYMLAVAVKVNNRSLLTWYSASLLDKLEVLRPDLTADATPGVKK